MVHRCCISSCKMNVRVAEAKGLSYHCFPLKDPHREKWIHAILPHVDRPEAFKVVQGYTRVCSRHFRIKEYSMDSKKRARLNSNAVPSVFPRKNSPLVVQSPIEAAKSQIVNKIKNNAMGVSNLVTSDDQLEATTMGTNSIQIKDEVDEKNLLVESATSSNDQMILNLLNSVTVNSVLDVIEQDAITQSQSLPDEANSDVSNDDKQDQTKRKRRKWNRTAFARTSKSKQKKASTITGVLDESTLDDDALGDLSLSNFLDLTRSNSLDLESELTVNNRNGSLGLNVAPGEKDVSRTSPSCLPVSDPILVEDLNLMSIEEQELLQSIQAVSLDCGEADMNLNLKNIHIGSTDLESTEGLTSELLSAPVQKSLLENPILLEDALISSASEMSLQSSKRGHYKKVANTNLSQTAVSTPSASEIEKLAFDLRSSLLTSSIELSLVGEELRLPVPEFPNHTPIIDISDGLLIPKVKDQDLKSCGDDSSKRDQVVGHKQSNKSGNKKAAVPRKKLVGITKKPKNSDKYFGKFSVERFCDSDKDIEYYTGFPTYSHFEAFFNSLESHVEKLKVTDIMHGVADLIRNQQQLEIQIPNGSNQASEESGTTTRDTAEEQKRRPITGRSLSRIDELFMTLVRLKRRLPEKVLGHMFYVSQPTVSRIIRAWTVLLSKLLEPIPSACETNIPPDGPKSRQTSSKTNGEHNYFTNKGIYIPDSFRQLFLSDVASAIISSAHNPRLSSSSNATIGTCNAKILVNNNNEEPRNASLGTNMNRRSIVDNSSSVSSSNECNCQYPCSCTTAAISSLADDCRVSFTESSIVSPCGEVEIDSNDFYNWSLLVNE